MRSSRTSTSTATSGSSVAPKPLATICVIVARLVAKKPVLASSTAPRAKRQGLLPQAVTLFQKDQIAFFDVMRRDPSSLGQRIVRGHREQKPVLEQIERFDIGFFDG